MKAPKHWPPKLRREFNTPIPKAAVDEVRARDPKNLAGPALYMLLEGFRKTDLLRAYYREESAIVVLLKLCDDLFVGFKESKKSGAPQKHNIATNALLVLEVDAARTADGPSVRFKETVGRILTSGKGAANGFRNDTTLVRQYKRAKKDRQVMTLVDVIRRISGQN